MKIKLNMLLIAIINSNSTQIRFKDRENERATAYKNRLLNF